jgi:hypothetical protein
MKKRDYRCGAKPLGPRGGVCGAPAREHNARQATILSPITGVELPQHPFIATEA